MPNDIDTLNESLGFIDDVLSDIAEVDLTYTEYTKDSTDVTTEIGKKITGGNISSSSSYSYIAVEIPEDGYFYCTASPTDSGCYLYTGGDSMSSATLVKSASKSSFPNVSNPWRVRAGQIIAVSAKTTAATQCIYLSDKGTAHIDVSDLESHAESVDRSLTINNLSKPFIFTQGYYNITAVGTTIDITGDPIESTTIKHVVTDCSDFDTFSLTLTAGGSSTAGARAWAFLDESYTVLTRSSYNLTLNNEFVTAPIGARYLIIQSNSGSQIAYNVETLAYKINKAVDITSNILGVESDYLFDDSWTRKTIGNGSGIGTTGKRYESSTKRLATYGVQDCSGLNSITFEPESGYKWELFLFDEALTRVIYDSGWTTDDALYKIPVGTKYCAVLIANTSDSAISLSEYTNVKIRGRIAGSRLDNIESSLSLLSLGYDKNDKTDEFCEHFNIDGDVSSFVFFTDPHIYNANVKDKYMDGLFLKLQTAYNSTPTEFIMCGGDWLQGGADDIIPSGPTQAQACSQLGFVDGTMHKLFSGYKPIFGNHDSNYKNTALAQKTINNLMFKEQGESYYDFLSGNTRYYVLDSGLDNNTGTLTVRRKEQILWLAEKLRTNTDAYVVICMHIFYSTTSSDWHNATITAMGTAISQLASAYNAKGTYTASWDSSASYDFSAVTGKIHYIMSGHLHGDWIVQHYGVTAVITTKALYDWTTPTFDLCLNDYTNNILCMIRVGNGVNRFCHTDKVVVPTTETLTASKITPITWKSDDVNVATVSDGVVTKAAAGYSLITAEDANGNLETWVVDCN